jgi:RNA polymerase sigma factor (sigma-70 family)
LSLWIYFKYFAAFQNFGYHYFLENLDEIIEGCKRKDAFYQEKLYRHFYPALYTLCKTFFSADHDIITALNNGMLRVFEHIDKYDAARGNFYSWLHTVVRNTALTFLRDSKEFRTSELTESLQDTVHENPFDNFNWEELFKVLKKLPTDTRAIVVLFYIEDISIKEITGILQMKEGTVKWHLSEGRKKLRKILKPETFSEK